MYTYVANWVVPRANGLILGRISTVMIWPARLQHTREHRNTGKWSATLTRAAYGIGSLVCNVAGAVLKTREGPRCSRSLFDSGWWEITT